MNFGTTSLAVPHAVSSRVASYSFTARLDLARITIPAPVLTRDRALLVGVGLDGARIDILPDIPSAFASCFC